MSKILAVVMTVYNEKIEHLKLAVESTLKSLSYVKDSKLIIYVDNFNEFISQHVIEYLTEIKSDNVNVYFSNMNIGLAESLNLVIREYCNEYKYIGRMDSDDVCYKKRFITQINEMMSNEIDIIGCDGYKINENGDKIGEIDNKKYPTFKFGNEMIHPSLIFKRESFNIIGGYRNYSAAQDYDFLCRAKLLNMNIVNIKEVLIDYRIRNTSIGQMRKKSQIMYKVEISKSFRNKSILLEELKLDYNAYGFYDVVEKKFKFNLLCYRFFSLFSLLHLSNYKLNILKKLS